MKNLKYILPLLLAALLSACSKDETETLNPETQGLRNAFTALSEIGIYKDAKAVLTFDKARHQYYCKPSKYLFRIQDNAGVQYANLQMDDMPTGSRGVGGTLTDNMELGIGSMKSIVMLKSDDRFVWLWCDTALTGIILPRIGI